VEVGAVQKRTYLKLYEGEGAGFYSNIRKLFKAEKDRFQATRFLYELEVFL